MFDFLMVSRVRDDKKGVYIYSPSFKIKSTIKDLMTRGGKFYAIYNEQTGLWETSDSKATELIDEQVKAYAHKDAEKLGILSDDSEFKPLVKLLSNADTKLIDKWHKYCQRDITEDLNYHELNQKVIFSNQTPAKKDYATKILDYPLEEGPTPAYDRCTSVWYLPDERKKWEWFVGCQLSGDALKIQKALIFYGEPGTGKSSVAEMIIGNGIYGGEEYYAGSFDATSLAQSKDLYGTDFLEDDPVVAIDGEANMSMVNARGTFNKIISHERVRINAKFTKTYYMKPACLLIMCANDPVQISPNSGLRRRIIDIQPTGNMLDSKEYDWCMSQIPFERSGIAYKCIETYKKLGRHYYDHYISEDMMNRTSPFQNYVVENYDTLKDGISLAAAYDLYTRYADESHFKNILVRYKFRDTLKLYFKTYEHGHFDGFKGEKIGIKEEKLEDETFDTWIHLKEQHSLFDDAFKDCKAQYEQEDSPEHPLKFPWDKCLTILKDILTTRIHYVRVPENLIVIDFDIKGKDGEKNLQLNLEQASKFPPTYCELSKSEQGIHLHYYYSGDVNKLSRIFGPNIEVKVFTGKSALRRRLTLCNDIPIATLSSGLPLKDEGDSKVVDEKLFENQEKLVRVIKKATKVERLPDGSKRVGYWKRGCVSTRQNIDLIETCLTNAYASGETYDVRDLKPLIIDFALQSTHQSQYCYEHASKMLYCSKDILDSESIHKEDDFVTDDYMSLPIALFDIEIFPSYRQALKDGRDLTGIKKGTPALLVVCYMEDRDDAEVVRLINPSPKVVRSLWQKYRLIGFNNLNYDNPMLFQYAAGYTIEELYRLSGRLISDDKEISRAAKPWESRNVSYTDIYDFASAGNKKGLKKWEIELHIHHKEWDKPWYLPVNEEDWNKVADYCANDVLATRAVFHYKKIHTDFIVREILADISGGTANMTTNNLAFKFLYGDNKHPGLIYTDLKTGKQYGPGEDPPAYIQAVIDDLGGPYMVMGKTKRSD